MSYRHPELFERDSGEDLWTDMELFEYDANRAWEDAGRPGGFWETWTPQLREAAEGIAEQLGEAVAGAREALGAREEATVAAFRRLLDGLGLPDAEAAFVIDLVRREEAADAFETMCDCAFADGSPVGPGLYAAVADLGQSLGVDPLAWRILENRADGAGPTIGPEGDAPTTGEGRPTA